MGNTRIPRDTLPVQQRYPWCPGRKEQSQENVYLYDEDVGVWHSTLIHVILQGGGDDACCRVDSEAAVAIAANDGVGWVVVVVLVSDSPLGIHRDLDSTVCTKQRSASVKDSHAIAAEIWTARCAPNNGQHQARTATLLSVDPKY